MHAGLAVAGENSVETLLLQHDPDGVPHARIIVDNQDSFHRSATKSLSELPRFECPEDRRKACFYKMFTSRQRAVLLCKHRRAGSRAKLPARLAATTGGHI